MIFPAHILDVTDVMNACRGHVMGMYDTTPDPCIPADLYGLGIDAEHIFGTVSCDSRILADFFGRPCRQLTSGIEVPTAYKVWQIVLALMLQTMEKEILTVESESPGCYAENNDLKVGELQDNATTGYVSKFIYTISGEILADTENYTWSLFFPQRI